MIQDELRWAHMTSEELVRELTIRTDLSPLETILLRKLEETMEDLSAAHGDVDHYKKALEGGDADA